MPPPDRIHWGARKRRRDTYPWCTGSPRAPPVLHCYRPRLCVTASLPVPIVSSDPVPLPACWCKTKRKPNVDTTRHATVRPRSQRKERAYVGKPIVRKIAEATTRRTADRNQDAQKNRSQTNAIRRGALMQPRSEKRSQPAQTPANKKKIANSSENKRPEKETQDLEPNNEPKKAKRYDEVTYVWPEAKIS